MAHLIEEELQDFVVDWNTHIMRANRLTGSPSAIPNDLYEMPGYYGIIIVIYLIIIMAHNNRCARLSSAN